MQLFHYIYGFSFKNNILYPIYMDFFYDFEMLCFVSIEKILLIVNDIYSLYKKLIVPSLDTFLRTPFIAYIY